MKRKHSDSSESSDKESQSNSSHHDTLDPVDFVGLRVRMKWRPTPAVRLGYRSGLVLQGLGDGDGSEKRWAMDFDEYGESKISGQLKKYRFWLRCGVFVHHFGAFNSTGRKFGI